MVEVKETIETTGSIVIVEMYAGIIITMIIVSIHDIYKKFKNNKKKKK